MFCRVAMSKVVVHLGKHHRTNSQKTEQVVKIEKWFIHPDFSRRTFQNDIGIIKLKDPVRLNRSVRPICLPSSGIYNFKKTLISILNLFYYCIDSDISGEHGTVVGWGRTEERGKSSSFPREVRVPIMTNEECKKKKYNPREITDQMFCAGYDQGKIDACQVKNN